MPGWENAVVRVEGASIGTGFVIDREHGLLLTCAHLIDDRPEVSVRLPDGTTRTTRVLENWAPDLDAALLQALDPLPESVAEPLLGLEVVAGHRFRSWGYHYAADPASLPIEGEIRGLGRVDRQPAILLSSKEVAEGMSGAPLVDLATGLVVGMVRRYHEGERWLACAVPLFAIADRYPLLRERTAEARYRRLLRAAYGFWERRFAPLGMTLQERLPEPQRGWIPPSFSVLEEQEERRGEKGQKAVTYRPVPLPGGLPEALERYQAVVLLGEPGAGKTTALSHLAGQQADDPTRIPLLVTLRRYERDEEVLPFLRRTWALALQDDLTMAIQAGETEDLPLHVVEETVASLAPLLEHLLEQGRLLLLLDGLNEMLGLGPGDPRLSRLAAFVDRARAKGNRVVISCRMLDYTNLRRSLELPLQPVRLESLDEERIRIFLRNYLGEERGEALARWLQAPEQRAVRDLCEIPFFLRLVAYLYEQEGQPPSRRIDLLDRYLQVAVRREQERRGERWPPAALVEPLADLALAMQEEGKLEFWENEAGQYLASFPYGGAAAALRLAEGAGLLRVTLTDDLRGTRLRFVHQLWQQDLAARALVRRAGGNPHVLWEFLRPHLLEERYTEVIPLAAARLEDADTFVQHLLKANRNDFWRQRPLRIAATALAEGASVREETWQAILDDLAIVARTRPMFEFERVSAQFALQVLTRLNAADRLLALARDEGVAAEVRQGAAEALGELGRAEEAAEVLLALARDEGVKADVRWKAVRALEELGRTEEAVEVLLALARDERVEADVRQVAAEALGELGRAEEAVEVLLALARDDRVAPWVCQGAVQALRELGRAEDLLALVRDEGVEEWVRREAVMALRKLGRAEDLLALAQDAGVETEVRREAVRALEELGRVEDLLALVRDERVDGWVCWAAAEALRKLGRAEEAVEVLLALARDERVEAGVRRAAAEALGKLGRAEEVAEVLLALARDAGMAAGVRWAAAEALGKLGRAEDLLALAQDKGVEADVRWKAVRALEELGRAEDLLALARDAGVETEVRRDAVRALEELGRVEDLLALARDRKVNVRVRWKAVQALGQLGRAEDLRSLAQDESVGFLVTQAAERELEKMGLRLDSPLPDNPRPFAEHLDELRHRLRICLLTWLLGTGIAAGLFPLLVLPALRALYGAPVGTVIGSALAAARWPAALTVGGGLALVVVVYHALRFAWPGLLPWEQRQAIRYAGIGFLLLYVIAPLIVFILSRTALWDSVALPMGWKLYLLHRIAWLPSVSYLMFLMSRRILLAKEFQDWLGMLEMVVRRWLFVSALLLPALALLLLPFWTLSLLMGATLGFGFLWASRAPIAIEKQIRRLGL
ncbi:MAG TPA: twin-arginine translocase subunit TatC [Thermoflexus sp.]|nr:twin-arginine translocase subunit TatC [Thermoflexus sp.]